MSLNKGFFWKCCLEAMRFPMVLISVAAVIRDRNAMNLLGAILWKERLGFACCGLGDVGIGILKDGG